ncbi:uncharacterized protein [Paralichthys olivaceus]|uniref:uncharacterized protein isoform X1 n=1 Tax=Paralichthys olivaceus TaxID=8255 RepID=UPI00375258C0
MEQYLRLALWMFLFIGHLQAKPIITTTSKPQGTGFNMGDLGFNFLRNNVTCDPRLNFTSPKNVQEHCYYGALKCFKDELMRTANNFTDGKNYISQTWEALDQNTDIKQCDNTSECQWENSKKPFAGFVNDMETFVQQVNSNKMVKC